MLYAVVHRYPEEDEISSCFSDYICRGDKLLPPFSHDFHVGLKIKWVWNRLIEERRMGCYVLVGALQEEKIQRNN